MNLARFISFKTQRAIFALIFSLLPTALSIGVLWNHLNSLLIFTGIYLILTKIGLLMVEFTAMMLVVWELSVKDKILSHYCFFANLVIVFLMLINVGAVFQYATVKTVTKTSQELALETNKKLINLANQSTQDQTAKLLEQIASNRKLRNSRTISEIAKTAITSNAQTTSEMLTSKPQKAAAPTSLLSRYVESAAVIVVPTLFAFILAALALYISKNASDLNSTEVIVMDTGSEVDKLKQLITASNETDDIYNEATEVAEESKPTINISDRSEILNHLRKND